MFLVINEINRANTLGSYLDINLKMAKLNGKNSKQSRPNSASVAEKSQIGVDSMIGDDTKIGERCSVKRSVIGAHCSIGKNVKISDSVIHDYVTIEDK
ncbi:hypothetical protein HK099_004465 [Clydaea vesicula]|uniref:EIF2B subunit epsilon/gamma LbH domain-containing protein n=1 Tax=Clydaea vesicula TaxID=447962 RepID=A0AAD5U0G2_9FUNG|nr:hypothetical protein HK099_004465 [Clydaea vesicula]